MSAVRQELPGAAIVETPPSGRSWRCLVVGAGEAGRTIARDLRRMPSFGIAPVGFLDDNRGAGMVAGLPILGTTAELEAVAAAEQIDVVIIAIPSLPTGKTRLLAEAAAAAGVAVRYLPSFVAALERDARISDLRRLRVDQLLGRDELHVVRIASRAVVEGKRVLVTGAGGSIGSELCRQINGFQPKALYMLDHDESNLHRLQMRLHGEALLDSDDLIIADIRDAERIHQVFAELRPEVVFHAAAHKHLPLLERNPCEGVKSNVLGTKHLVEASLVVGAERFILISTDKAADPTSILGVTKRLAEMVVQANAGGPTRMASVRFGNVLGSRGSFLSILSEQIENGEAVTVTHPDVTRFFMTVEEAVGLVIEAASMASDGETFVLDMGEPVRIVDLVRNYAEQVHLGEDQLAIRFTGLRRGEKLNEALFSETEKRVRTEHPKIWATHGSAPAGDFELRLNDLFAAAQANQRERVLWCLSRVLPDYQPSTVVEQPLSLGAPYPDGF
jgi:FlaA1/EpsC-like NDP-sugar epimerase